jgi:hypothetical protein
VVPIELKVLAVTSFVTAKTVLAPSAALHVSAAGGYESQPSRG